MPPLLQRLRSLRRARVMGRRLRAWWGRAEIALARRFGLATKGDLAPGCDADLVVFDRDAETVVDSTRLHSAAGWSPYAGRELRGRVTHVVSRGELVFDGEVHGHPGRGEVLDPRSTVAPPGRPGATGPVTR